MKLTIRHFTLFITALAALAISGAHAQASSGFAPGGGGLSLQQDNTNVVLKIVQMKAQLEAIEKETLRRLACQANPDPYSVAMVSTNTGCQEIPGLRAFVAGHVAASTPAPTPSSCNSPWGGAAIASGQSVTAYAAATMAYGTTCSSESRACTNGSLSGSFVYSSCTVSADPWASCTTGDAGYSGPPLAGGVHRCPAPVPGHNCPESGGGGAYPYICY